MSRAGRRVRDKIEWLSEDFELLKEDPHTANELENSVRDEVEHAEICNLPTQ